MPLAALDEVAVVTIELFVIVTTMLVTATLVLIGPRRVVATLRGVRWRLRELAVPVALLLGVLGVRMTTADAARNASLRIVGMKITADIYRFESQLFATNPVTVLQSFQSPELTSYFVFTYMYAYVFLISFPFVAYFALEETEKMSTLLVAFALNYAIGYVCYTLFIAFGPRNFDPNLFQNLLYQSFPQARYLTGTVNGYTNVFPSLHTSLSATTILLAWFSRDEYPLWFPISAVIGVSVILSTMYLGIHWFTDVIGGTLLAVGCVYVARRYQVDDAARSVRRYLGRRLAPIASGRK